MFKQLFSEENKLALLLCLVAITVIVMTAASSPRWIYQGY
jgi:O-antigen/teichoic acid export membrane protein